MTNIEKHIVSIDLGTSKIAITVAQVEGNDVQIIYYKESPSAGIRYSGVYNVSQATDALKKAIATAEEELGITITQAVVGVPKYPIRTEVAKQAIIDRGECTDITAEDIEELKSYALSTYPHIDGNNEAIFGAVAQSFSDGENFQIIENDIIGMTSDILEGYFKIFIGKQNDLKKINLVMERAGVIPVQKFFTADTTAKAVLYESEMETGVALVDIGAGSTSVSIYEGNVMRHYASIPFGGKNITDDIKNESEITEQLAENIKLAFGACMPEKLLSLSEKVLHIRSVNGEGDKTLPVKYLSEIITARVEEIIMAILYEIEKSGFADMLRSGIVITGGTAQITNICNFIHDISGYKVRTGYPRQLFSYSGCTGLSETSAATSIGLIQAAKYGINCAIVQEVEEEDETEQPEMLIEEKEETVVETLAEEKEEVIEEEKVVDNTNRDLFGNVVKEEEKKPEPKKKKKEVKEPRTGKKPIWTLLGDLFNEVGKEIDDSEV